MARIVAIDYGKKRVGLAVTDPLQLIATGLTTVPASGIFDFLKQYVLEQEVEKFVVGDPKNLNNTPAEIAAEVDIFIKKLEQTFPAKEVVRVDERFTSKMAAQTMVMSGMKKKDRQRKENLDEISATIILQSYLERYKR